MWQTNWNCASGFALALGGCAIGLLACGVYDLCQSKPVDKSNSVENESRLEELASRKYLDLAEVYAYRRKLSGSDLPDVGTLLLVPVIAAIAFATTCMLWQTFIEI